MNVHVRSRDREPPAAEGSQSAAVLFLAFNRPDLLARVVEGMRGAPRRRVFVSIDGPRANRPEDAPRCTEVRKVAEAIEWASEVCIKTESTNLGCGLAVSAAISWALQEVPEIIVIEEDCLPHLSFLRFCDELLERYRDDERVMQIAGTNWGADARRYDGYSYGFTSFAPIWGWATWRRAWRLYDYELESWPRLKASATAAGMALSRRFRRLLERDWDTVRGGSGTWDHQWQYTLLRHHGLSVSPAKNLVVNIGLREDGTQQTGPDRIFSRLPLEELEFPLRHPPEVLRNVSVERVFERIYWQKLGWPGRLYRCLVTREAFRRVIRRIVPRPC